MKKQNPATGKMSRISLRSFTSANQSLFVLGIQHLTTLYALHLEITAVFAATAFAGGA